MGLRLFSSSAKDRPRTAALTPPWGEEPRPPDAFLSVEYTRLHRVEVNFDHTWQLTGIRLREKESRVTLALRWRCLRRVGCWLRCFAHLVDERGERIASLDHDLMGGQPPPAEWAPGDEGYEVRYLYLGPGLGSQSHVALGPNGYEIQNGGGGRPALRLLLGLYDVGTGLRLPVVASSVVLEDACTAAVVKPNTVPGKQVVFRMDPTPSQPCLVAFEGGLELIGYSVTRRDPTLWLRLRWRGPEQERGALRFFGHGLAQPDPEGETLVGFDQELFVEQHLGGAEFELNILRTLEGGAASAAFLRGGVCTSAGLQRLAIRASTLPSNATERCFFLALT